MNKKLSLAIIFVLTIQGCAMERSVSKTEDSRPCVANYSTEGGFLTGKQFKTFQDFPRASKALAFDSLVATIASSGYQITNSNKASGIISANQTVTGGHGKTVPINAVITNTAVGGIRVELVMSLSGGLVTSADSLQDGFCKILASVNQNIEPAQPAPKAAASKTVTNKMSNSQKQK